MFVKILHSSTVLRHGMANLQEMQHGYPYRACICSDLSTRRTSHRFNSHWMILFAQHFTPLGKRPPMQRLPMPLVLEYANWGGGGAFLANNCLKPILSTTSNGNKLQHNHITNYFTTGCCHCGLLLPSPYFARLLIIFADLYQLYTQRCRVVLPH